MTIASHGKKCTKPWPKSSLPRRFNTSASCWCCGDIIEINSGTFEFNISEKEFPIVIAINSNTNFLLDVLTALDNERAEKQGLRKLGDEIM